MVLVKFLTLEDLIALCLYILCISSVELFLDYYVLISFKTLFAGRLGIVDHDVVELNNMHRQVQIGNLLILL